MPLYNHADIRLIYFVALSGRSALTPQWREASGLGAFFMGCVVKFGNGHNQNAIF
jgi:hypothetical protein